MKRKYPASLFVMGVFLELFRLRLILLLVVLLLTAGIFIPDIPLAVSGLLFVVCLTIAIFKQIRQRNTITTMNPHAEANDLLNKMFADNDKGYRNVIDAVDEIIKRNDLDS